MRKRAAVFCFFFFLSASLFTSGEVIAQPYTFTHLAGSTGGSGSDDGTGTAARFYTPVGIARDASGNLYVVESRGSRIRKISPGGAVTTLAGLGGSAGGVDLPRFEARFYNPHGITIDPSGNLYVADALTNTIRKVTPGGVVSTFAGTFYVTGSANGTGASAEFNQPSSVARGPSGDLFVADTNNHTIRKITPAGVVSTYAGGAGVPGTTNATGTAARFMTPKSVAVDSAGVVYVADTGNHTIRRIDTDRAVTTLAGIAGTCGVDDTAGTFCQPEGLAADNAGNVYVAGNGTVRRITSAGVVSTLAGAAYQGGVADGNGAAARFMVPRGITFGSDGHLYVTETIGEKVRRVTLAGDVTTIAGKAPESGTADATGAAARFRYPEGIAVDADDNVYVSDHYNYAIRKITPAGLVSTFSGLPGTSGTTDIPARFSDPMGLTVDSSGNVYVAEQYTHTIRKLTSAGGASTLAGSAYQPGTTNDTGSMARFNTPTDVAVDGAGNVFVADYENHAIRQITPGGVVTTFAGQIGVPGFANATGLSAQFNHPFGIAIDSSGTLFVADRDNHRIRKITTGGVVTTFAGVAGGGHEDGPGTSARFHYPTGIDVDSSGNVYVTEAQLQTIRKITSAAVVSTIGGLQSNVGTEDGTASHARFTWPGAIAVDGTGKLYIAVKEGQAIIRGLPALSAAATIDDASAPVDVTRQLNSSPATATAWTWSIIRKPADSTAALSSTNTANPTFTPDIPDLYTFRLVATNGASKSITTVSLRAECPAISVSPSSLPSLYAGTPFSQAITAGGGTAPYKFSLASGTLPTGLTLSAAGSLTGTPTTPGVYNFTVRALDYYGCTGERAYSVTVYALQAPTNFVASGTGDFTISLSWNPVAGATDYSLYRREAGGPLTLVTTTASTSFGDGPLQNSRTFIYFVRANNAADQQSPNSTSDYGTTLVYTDPTLTPGVTNVKAVHVTQLRTAVNSVRLLAGLAAYPFTDGTLTVVPVKAVHVTQLRTALAEARTLLGLSAIMYIDGVLTDVEVKAVHFTQLRNAAN